MTSFSSMSTKGGQVSKQSRFYDDWSSGNHAVNNTLLYQERVKVENRRLKLTVRDSVADALRQSTHRMQPPPASHRSTGLTTRRTTGRTTSSSARLRQADEEEEANALAAQMLEAQRQVELDRLIEEEQQTTQLLEEKFNKISEYLLAQQKEEEEYRSPERPVRFKERKRLEGSRKVLVPDPVHHRVKLVTARLSGSDQLLTERGIVRQKNFLKKEARNPRILPRKTVSENAKTIAMQPRMRTETKSW